jgi:hypothetical protein
MLVDDPRSIPDLETLDVGLSLRKQLTGERDGLILREAAEIFGGDNMAAAEEKAPQNTNSQMDRESS